MFVSAIVISGLTWVLGYLGSRILGKGRGCDSDADADGK